MEEALNYQISFDADVGTINIGNALIARIYQADDFPCRDEDKSDDEHDAEIEALAKLICELAEEGRKARLARAADQDGE